METTPLRKLTAKLIMGKLPDQPPEKTTVPLYQIWGQAQGVVRKEGDYGPWCKLIGTFEAVNLSTGEVFAAPQAFLHAPYDEMIAQKLEGENPADAITFAFEVGVQRPVSGTVAYEYAYKPIRDPKAADPLEQLRANITGLKALEDKSGGKSGGKK